MPRKVCVVLGLIFDSNRKVLLAKRKAFVDQGGLWEFPGGKIEVGETQREALQRELQEELQLSVEVGPCVGKVDLLWEAQGLVTFFVYVCRPMPFDAVPTMTRAIDNFAWFDILAVRSSLYQQTRANRAVVDKGILGMAHGIAHTFRPKAT